MEFINLLEDGTRNLIPRNLNTEYAFIADCGNFGFDFDREGVSTHFIVTALIVDGGKISKLEEEVEAIRIKHFRSDEMKSSTLGEDDTQRIKILEDIRKLDFHVFSLVVDKRRIVLDSGLAFEDSFIKFLNNMLHKELYQAYPRLQMIAGEHENKEFMESFKRYVHERHTPDMFEYYDFGFAPGRSSTVVQLADFICGTIATGYDEKKKSDKFSDFMSFLKDKVITILHWPESYRRYLVNTAIDTGTQFDEKIATLALRQANSFIELHENSDVPEVVEQVLVIKFLKFKLQFNRPDLYVPTHEIIDNLYQIRKRRFTVHYLRTKIVAKLRDAGVIIASSKHGYKLPISEKELYDFANQSNMVIKPMLSRLKTCRDLVKAATKNGLDILDKPEYYDLKKYFDE